MDTAIQCLDLVSKCGPTSGFRSSLGSYFLYRDVIAATKTDLGKPQFEKCRVYLGIAQIAIASPPPFTQMGTLGHFISVPT